MLPPPPRKNADPRPRSNTRSSEPLSPWASSVKLDGVTPFATSGGQDLSGAASAQLRNAGIAEEELRSFALKDDCFRGTLGGAPFTACAVDGLPRIAGPRPV